jgi:hypothetical protein
MFTQIQIFLDPGSRIPDPTTKKEYRRWKKLSYLFCRRKLHKIADFFYLLTGSTEKKFEPIDKEFKYHLTQKNVEIRVGDPEKIPRIRIEGSKKHRIQNRNTVLERA